MYACMEVAVDLFVLNTSKLQTLSSALPHGHDMCLPGLGIRVLAPLALDL